MLQLTDKDLRRLSRTELLEMLIAQMKENDTLRSQLQEAAEQLKNREIQIRESGSMAEAALRLNQVFEAADAAAAQYLDNVRNTDGQQALCARMEEETRQRCDAMIADAEARCAIREQALEARYREVAAQLKQLRQAQQAGWTQD